MTFSHDICSRSWVASLFQKKKSQKKTWRPNGCPWARHLHLHTFSTWKHKNARSLQDKQLIWSWRATKRYWLRPESTVRIWKNTSGVGLSPVVSSLNCEFWLVICDPCWNSSLQKRRGSKTKSPIPPTDSWLSKQLKGWNSSTLEAKQHSRYMSVVFGESTGVFTSVARSINSNEQPTKTLSTTNVDCS